MVTDPDRTKVRQMFEPDAEAMPHEELARLQDERLRTLVGRLLALGGRPGGSASARRA